MRFDRNRRTFEWYHTIDFGGIVTRRPERSRAAADAVRHPRVARRTNRARRGPGEWILRVRVRDARRGACRDVRATDLDQTRSNPELAESVGHSRRRRGGLSSRRARVRDPGAVDRRRPPFCSVYDLTPNASAPADRVLRELLLHLTDPLRALYAIRRVCQDEAIICTAIDTHLLVGRSVPREVHRHAPTATPSGCRRSPASSRFYSPPASPASRPVSTFRLRSKDGLFNTPHGTIRALVCSDYLVSLDSAGAFTLKQHYIFRALGSYWTWDLHTPNLSGFGGAQTAQRSRALRTLFWPSCCNPPLGSYEPDSVPYLPRYCRRNAGAAQITVTRPRTAPTRSRPPTISPRRCCRIPGT